VAATGVGDQREAFSNWGPGIDLAAPGVGLLSLRARGTDFRLGEPGATYRAGAGFVGTDRRYYRASGTSFAAPLVAGVASLVWGQQPTLTMAEVRRLLVQTARDVGVPGVDQYTGYGRLDARAALQADRTFRLEGAITGVAVAQSGGQTVVRVQGTAQADRLREAWLELGRGGSPTSWKRVGATLRRPVSGGVLGDLPATELAGSTSWTIRVIVQHQNGRQREARFALNLQLGGAAGGMPRAPALLSGGQGRLGPSG
jgi:hypothetical protein